MVKQYKEYKASGIEWIGEIPTKWNIVKLKFLTNIKFSSVDRHEIPEEMKVSICHYPQAYKNDKINTKTSLSTGTCSQNEFSNFSLKKGQVIITKDSETANDIGIPSYVEEDIPNAVCGYHLAILESAHQNFYTGFLFRYLQSNHVNYYFENNSNGVTRFGLGKPTIENLAVPLPSFDEQSQIALYLDNQTSIIDQIICKKQKLITLLKEKRQAIINEAVTKGLNPNVKMKDSGLEWLGEIPEEWHITKLKFIIDSLESGVSVNSENISVASDSSEIGVLKTSCVFEYLFNSKENKKVNADELDRVKCPVRSNTIIISRMNTPELVGASGYVMNDYPNLFLPDRLWQTVINSNIKVDVEYISYILKTEIYKSLFCKIATGTSPSMKNIGQDAFLNLSIPFPSIEDQNSIKHFIRQFDQKTSKTIIGLNETIEKLKKYRQSIISEAVTGKVDVRDWKEDTQNN